MRELSVVLCVCLSVVAASVGVLSGRACAAPSVSVVGCKRVNVISIESDLYGQELVRIVPYLSCEEPRQPADKRYKALCHEGANPFAPVLWALPGDRDSLRWLCQPGV